MVIFLRTGWDSNPRYREAHSLSKRADSATLAPVHHFPLFPSPCINNLDGSIGKAVGSIMSFKDMGVDPERLFDASSPVVHSAGIEPATSASARQRSIR